MSQIVVAPTTFNYTLGVQGRRELLPGTEGGDAGVLCAVAEKLRAGEVSEGMTELLPVLQRRRMHSTEMEWSEYVQGCLAHPLRELLHQDPLTRRAFVKPRGYAGDAELLDFIYGREEGWPVPEGTSDLGKRIFEFTTASSACEAVRARRGFLANAIDNILGEQPRAQILALACGHLREALLSAGIRRRSFGRFVALDFDSLSLEEVARSYGRYGVETQRASVRQLLSQRVELADFDFVYATGLMDYLPLVAAQRLTFLMFRMLRNRGRLLVANFLPGILDVGYMETYMGWKLVFRNRQQMLELSGEIPLSQIRDIRIFAEENQNIIFLEVSKR